MCRMSTCQQRDCQGNQVCKRQAPWLLVEKTIFHTSGMLDLQHSYQFLNGYSSAILVCLHCNNNIKMVVYGRDTKNLGWYLTNYQSKDLSKSYNMSALLGLVLTYHHNHLTHLESLWEQNWLLIY